MPYDINTSEQISERGELSVSRTDQTNGIKQWVNAVFYWYQVSTATYMQWTRPNVNFWLPWRLHCRASNLMTGVATLIS